MLIDTAIAEKTAFDDAIKPVNEVATNAPLEGQHLYQFNFGGGRFEVSDEGVYFIGTNDDGDDKKPLFICSRIDVIGFTSSTNGDNWGRMVSFTDRKNRLKRLPIPATMWQGDGLRLREMLADMGLDISSNGTSRKLMMDYLASATCTVQFESVDKLGWHDRAFVLPDRAISNNALDYLIYQSSNPPPPYAQAGTLEEWRENMARYASGNSRLLFAISVAFAAPMMHLAEFRTSTGFHIRGSSSSGKSTIMEAAVSVYGKPEHYMKTWRNTSNALEGTALAHNDGLLALDELSQINPKDLDIVAYMLGNGQKKGRATITGNSKPVSTWRLLYLSNGEESLAGMLAKAGIKTNTGQEMRFIDIEADAGCGFGCFDTLHELNGAALSNTIKGNAGRYYGTAGIAWLNLLVNIRESADFRASIEAFKRDALPPTATSQHGRVCDYFGLVATAGELATEQGLTGWQSGEVWQACKRLFAEWMESFGHDNKESSNIIAHVRGFIEAHGASRFESINSDGTERIINRVGFVRHKDNGLEYLILPEAFKRELCGGYDVKTVTNALIEAGILIKGNDGRPKQKARITALGGLSWVYVIRFNEAD
jgi:uncharacterized protein (DUF927 family)